MRYQDEVTLKRCARELKMPYDSLYRHYRNGSVPHRKLGNIILVQPHIVKAVLTAVGYQQRQRAVAGVNAVCGRVIAAEEEEEKK